jgi:hypothetical protein
MSFLRCGVRMLQVVESNCHHIATDAACHIGCKHIHLNLEPASHHAPATQPSNLFECLFVCLFVVLFYFS